MVELPRDFRAIFPAKPEVELPENVGLGSGERISLSMYNPH